VTSSDDDESGRGDSLDPDLAAMWLSTWTSVVYGDPQVEEAFSPTAQALEQWLDLAEALLDAALTHADEPDLALEKIQRRWLSSGAHGVHLVQELATGIGLAPSIDESGRVTEDVGVMRQYPRLIAVSLRREELAKQHPELVSRPGVREILKAAGLLTGSAED